MLTDTTTSDESEYAEFEDPAFKARVAEYIATEESAFQAWLAESDMGAHVDVALQAARKAFADAADLPEEENPRSAIAMIALGHRRAKPLVQALYSRQIGEQEIWSTYTWDIGFRHIMGRRLTATKSANSAQRHATVEAFALALSKPGFELSIWRE